MESKTYFIETYGCQMNFADSEIVNSIMIDQGHQVAKTPEEADVIFVNTCSIRDNAERRVWDRLKYFRSLRTKKKQDKIVGVLGCMAERIREKFLDEHKLVDMVVGPDAYRDIPGLLSQVDDGRKAVNVILSLEETYADIAPVRTTGNGVTAFVSIMRGCDNMCSFCVVPFTRGRERSRPMTSILHEIEQLAEQGYKEVTLLGQNVNSYLFEEADFTRLMDEASQRHPEIRFRFSSPHPKDFPEPLIHLIAERPNLCNYIHIPAQSGNTEMLKRMRRPYTREEYITLTERMREIIPGVALSTDLITGFCGETEQQHEDTLSLIRTVNYELAYMFAYSERERTLAQRKYEDDVPEEVKKRRLTEIIDLQMGNQERLNSYETGRIHLVLAEGTSKRNDDQLNGRTDTNKMVVFDREDYRIGDYVAVEITGHTSATLFAKPLHKSSIADFHNKYVMNKTVLQNA